MMDTLAFMFPLYGVALAGAVLAGITMLRPRARCVLLRVQPRRRLPDSRGGR
jgi:hypothetical protein